MMGQELLNFDGATFDRDQDAERLTGQLGRLWGILRAGQWWTLARLAAAVGCSETSASARLRDLRKDRFGGHLVTRRRVPGSPGLWEYRLELRR